MKNQKRKALLSTLIALALTTTVAFDKAEAAVDPEVTTAINDAVAVEATARANADSGLSDRITAMEEAVGAPATGVPAGGDLFTRINKIDGTGGAIEGLSKAISDEASIRGQSDGVLHGRIDDEIDARVTADGDLQKQITTNAENILENKGAIEQEVKDRKTADEGLQTQITANKDNIDANAKDIAKNADAIKVNADAIDQNKKDIKANKEAIDQNKKDIAQNAKDINSLDKAVGANTAAIQAEALARETADNLEATKRINADDALEKEIKNEAATREDADKKLDQAIKDEAKARDDADKKLQGQIDDNKMAITGLDARLGVDEGLIAKNKKAIEQEAADRKAADDALGTRIDNEAKARKDADDALGTRIDNEAKAREDADKALGVRIDNEKKARENADKLLLDKITVNENNIKTNADNIAQEVKDRKEADVILGNAIIDEASTRLEADNALSRRIDSTDNRLDKVGAGAAALAALHPLDFDSDKKLSFATGLGKYAGQTSAAIGAFYRPDENTMISLGGAMGNGEDMVNLGVSFAIGSGNSPYASMSKKELVREVNQMKAENETIKAENKDIRNELNKLKALVAELAAKK